MTTRPSEPSSRRLPAADLPRRDKPVLLADRDLRPGRPGEQRRAPVLPPLQLLGLGEQLPSDYYLG